MEQDVRSTTTASATRGDGSTTVHNRFDRRRDEDMGASISTLDAPGGKAGENSAHHSRTPSRRRAETQDSEKAGRTWAREVDDPWWPCLLTLDGGGIRGYSSLIILKALMHEIWLWEEKLDREEQEGENGEVGSPTQMHGDEDKQAEGGADGENVDINGQEKRTRDETEAARTEHSYGVASGPPQLDAPKAPLAQMTAQDNLTIKVTKDRAMSEEELLPCHYFDFMYGTSTGGLIATILGRLRMTVSEGLDLYRSVSTLLLPASSPSDALADCAHPRGCVEAGGNVVADSRKSLAHANAFAGAPMIIVTHLSASFDIRTSLPSVSQR